MKAIYINLDPYLQAVADWLNAGKPGTAPSFDPLPVAVTIPLCESAAFLYLGTDSVSPTATVDGQSIFVSCVDQTTGALPPETETGEAQLSLSRFSSLETYGYSPLAVSGDFSATYEFSNSGTYIDVTIPVLVRRETASGPVDLVDFTPPAAAIAAGTDLKGTKFNGNEIVAAAGTGALSAPAGS